MLDHPSRQNFKKKTQLKSSVIDSDSDSDIVLDLGNIVANTSHSERGRGRGTAVRSRRGRGSRARGNTSSRGRVSGDLNMSSGPMGVGKLVLIRQGISSGKIMPTCLGIKGRVAPATMKTYGGVDI
jgi:hypothetical protein